MDHLSKMYSFTQVISESLSLTKGINVEKQKYRKNLKHTLEKYRQKLNWKKCANEKNSDLSITQQYSEQNYMGKACKMKKKISLQNEDGKKYSKGQNIFIFLFWLIREKAKNSFHYDA